MAFDAGEIDEFVADRTDFTTGEYMGFSWCSITKSEMAFAVAKLRVGAIITEHFRAPLLGREHK